ncbi:MAG TPA: diguanylate cyclase [Thermoanaerobaculia bacterium]|nr:diguanylate cyclase [Thermoanaerobaculia bacterium]
MDAEQHLSNRRRSDPNDETARIPIFVLAVDDDPAYLRLIELFLKEVGFHAKVAGGGEECLEKMRLQDFDLVLIDLTMPGMSGLDTLKAIRREEKLRHVYSMALTARDDLNTKIAALNAGFDGFLGKSISNDEMLARLKSTRRLLATQKRLRRQNTALYHMAITDALTGIGNRRFFFSRAEEVRAAGAKNVSVILFDLNLFKMINDGYGHLTGDRILADVGGVFRDHIREGDVVARYGGDEFAMIVIGVTKEEGARVAQRMCERVSALRWRTENSEISITMAHGIANSEYHPGASVMDLIAICDEDLYRRKRDCRGENSASAPNATDHQAGS